MQCAPHYKLINSICQHYLWPPTIWTIIGTLILSLTNSLATLAGIGGGSIALVILMNFFEYLPKDASLVVFGCVLGTSFGNTYNLIYKAFNDKPIIQYHIAFVSIPFMFVGSFIGVLMNQLFPSIITYSIIITVFLISLKRTYNRFITQYQKQNQQNLLVGDQVHQLHSQSIIQPFKNQLNLYIFKNLAALMIIIIIFAFIRGSSKFPSIFGLTPCSILYWIIFLFSFFVILTYAYRNMLIFHIWYQKDQLKGKMGYKEEQIQANFKSHIKQILIKSIFAGIFSGFGLGGGIFLVPMYRNLGCKPLQATATCSFGICITSFINFIQAVAIGATKLSQFLYFVMFLGIAGYIASKFISAELRKRNRFSFVQGILFGLTIIATINIPISLYRRYVDSNYNSKVIFGFGRLC